MPRFRSTQPPQRQVDSVIARIVDSGALRRNPARPYFILAPPTITFQHVPIAPEGTP